MYVTQRALTYPLMLSAALASPLAMAVSVTGGGYTASDVGAGAFVELSLPNKSPIEGATRVLGNHDDSATGAINLGFSFKFFNQTYSQVFITSNGLLTFGSTTSNNDNTAFNTEFSFHTMPMIAPAWNDWTTTFSGTDGVYYKTFGAPGTKIFVVEWHDTKTYDTASNSNHTPVSFEAVLFEGSNAIEFRYGNMNTGGSSVNPDASFGATSTVGIRDPDGYLNGRYLQWSNNQAVLASNSGILITPVPEPETWAMLLSGLACIGAIAKRRQNRAAPV